MVDKIKKTRVKKENVEEKKAFQMQIGKDLLDMLETLKIDLVTPTFSGVITQCVSNRYYQIHPVYKNTVPVGDTVESMQKRAKAKIQMKDAEVKAKEQLRIQPLIESCINDFKGRVEDGTCIFTAFTPDKADDMVDETIDLESCNPDVAEARVFLPVKQAVFNSRKDVRKLFGIE